MKYTLTEDPNVIIPTDRGPIEITLPPGIRMAICYPDDNRTPNPDAVYPMILAVIDEEAADLDSDHLVTNIRKQALRII